MNIKPKRLVALVMAIFMAAAIVLPALSARADASNFNTGARYFTDVTPDKWYYEAVNTMAAAGILNGYGDGTFKPNNPMTAGELATVLWNMIYGKDWCKANELFNRFNNGYATADYSDPNYPGPRVEKWGRVLDGWSPYRTGSHDVYPSTWDGGAALAIYGDYRIDPKNNDMPHKGATIQISQGRFCGSTLSPGTPGTCDQVDAIYYRDMSGLAVVAMSKERVTRGFAISELVNVLRETGNLQKLYDASGSKAIYANGSAIPDWSAVTDVYHDACAGSRKNARTTFITDKEHYHDYTWAWNYIDDPGNIKISGGYANTWFSRDVLLAYQAGIIDGVDATGRCNVGATMTRAEVCQMLYNAGVGKTSMKPLVKNGTVSNILFIRDGKAYIANPVATRVACVYINGFGAYDINSGRVPNTDGNKGTYVYKPNDGIDIRQQEWPTHPEFWGK